MDEHEEHDEQHAVVPFRHRHDGWTEERQRGFLERLAETGCVTEACPAVGLTTTSAYRAFARMPHFAELWESALVARRPMLEDAAFERAVRGVAMPLTRLGQVVGQRQRYSDGLLRFLIERGDKRAKANGGAANGSKGRFEKPIMTREEATAEILRKLTIVEARVARQKRQELLAFEERMKREGWAP